VSRVVSSRPSKRPSSAVDYVREVLGGRAWAPMLTADELPPAYTSAARPSPSARSQRERIALAPDVELHVRRPLTRATNRRVEKLLDLARHILPEED
jgi:hypothetical protein